MPIPASGFSLQTVCNEFTTPVRYQNSPTLVCFLRFASQEQLEPSNNNITGCRLSQFGNKCRVELNGNPNVSAIQIDDTLQVSVTQCIGDTGRDMRISNANLAKLYVGYCADQRTGQNGIRSDWISDNTSCVCTTSSPTSITISFDLENPDPGNGNLFTTIYICGIGENGFGQLFSSRVDYDHNWVTTGL
jgi:hypothetical protein